MIAFSASAHNLPLPALLCLAVLQVPRPTAGRAAAALSFTAAPAPDDTPTLPLDAPAPSPCEACTPAHTPPSLATRTPDPASAVRTPDAPACATSPRFPWPLPAALSSSGNTLPARSWTDAGPTPTGATPWPRGGPPDAPA